MVTSVPPADLSSVDLVNYVLNVYVDGLLCIFGLIGNTLILMVLPRDGHPNSNRVLLQAMAVFDSIFLVYVFLYVVMRSLAKYTDAIPGYNDVGGYITAFVLPLGWTAQTCIIWTVLTIAIDRYVLLSYPLRAFMWRRSKRARWQVLAIALTAVLFNVPRWPYYYLVAFESAPQNSTFISHTHSGIHHFDEDLYQKIYSIGLTIIFLFIIPLTLMITLNLHLIKNMQAATKQRHSMSQKVSDKRSPAQLKLTRLVIIIISTFILCQLPDFIATILGAGLINIRTETYEYYAPFKETMLVLNSSINIILYNIFFDRFRRTLSEMIGCGCHVTNRYVFGRSPHSPRGEHNVSIISMNSSQSSGMNGINPAINEHAIN